MTKLMYSAVFVALLAIGTCNAAITPVDLSAWSVVQYELFSQPDASWALNGTNTVATQGVNADASILLSDFDIAGTAINGTWRVATSSDDDFMGFVFGYQNRGQYYLFDWKQSDQNDSLGFAQRGMSVKVVDTGGADPTGSDLWPTSPTTGNVAVLSHNTIPWQDLTDYEFNLNFTPGAFSITVKEGSTVLENWVINDGTFGDGKFGFYNYSQGNVVYSGFTQDDDPPPLVPEPSACIVWSLLGLTVASGSWWKRRRS